MTKDAATLCRVFRRRFGECSGNSYSVEMLVTGAMRYAQQYCAEMGFARWSSGATHATGRVPLFAEDYPWSCSVPSWPPYLAFLANVAPALRVGPYFLLGVSLSFGISSGLCGQVRVTRTSTRRVLRHGVSSLRRYGWLCLSVVWTVPC